MKYRKIFWKTNSRGVTLWPFGIYLKRFDYPDIDKLKNHECIHWQQQKEMLGIFFYLWYLIEWFINIFKYKNRAYIKISMEQEGYHNRNNLSYLDKRKRFAWFKYLKYKPIN